MSSEIYLDQNGAQITTTETPLSSPKPNPLATEWSGAVSTDAKLNVIAKALGIV